MVSDTLTPIKPVSPRPAHPQRPGSDGLPQQGTGPDASLRAIGAATGHTCKRSRGWVGRTKGLGDFRHRLQRPEGQIKSPALSRSQVTCCAIPGKFFNLSEPQASHLRKSDKTPAPPNLTKQLQEVNKVVIVMGGGWCKGVFPCNSIFFL